MAEFDLAKLMQDVSKADTGREQIVYLPYASIIPDAGNGYSMAGVEELARNIELVGLQQPPRVRPTDEDPDVYRIISGHRRHAAIGLLIDQGSQRFARGVPCIIDSAAASAAMRELQLLMGNADNRVMTQADQMQQAERVSDCIRRLEEEGYQFPGRHRDWVAKLSGMSRTKIARLDAIRHNLAASLLEHFNAGELGISAAYRLSQEKEQIQHEVYRTYGRGVNDLTDVQLEEAIARRKAPRQDPPIKAGPKETAGWDVDAYLENRRKEDDDFFEMLSGVAKVLIEPIDSVNSRSEGIEALKRRFLNYYASAYGTQPYITGSAKGLTLKARGYDQIFRTWTEVYDMLCTIALNRAANGCAWDEDEEDEDEEPEEEMPTVRWESRAVTPPQREPLLLYQLTNAGPKYTPAVYHGGAVFRKPAWSGQTGAELSGIAQQFSMWMQFPDPNSYGEEYKIAALAAAPAWQTGDPPEDGVYCCRLQTSGRALLTLCRWLGDGWYLMTNDSKIALECLGWWPVPKESEEAQNHG